MGVTGMPIGPPSHRPAPKSACTVLPRPIAATKAAESPRTGSRSPRECPPWSAGKIGHDPPLTGAPERPADALGPTDAAAGEPDASSGPCTAVCGPPTPRVGGDEQPVAARTDTTPATSS